MEVLHFYKTSYPDTCGGVEQFVRQMCLGAHQRGVRSRVLSLAKGPHAAPCDMGGYWLHRSRLLFEVASTGFSLSAFADLIALAKTADVIHYHFPWPFMDLVHFATRVKKPTVVTYHSDIVRQKHLLKCYQPLMKKFLASTDAIVATSPNYVATSPVLSSLTEKVSVIPIGLDKTTYALPGIQRLQHWRSQCGEAFFLFVGALRYYKGLHTLLEAALRVTAPIVIAGMGPMEAELKAEVERRHLSHVHFVGAINEEDKAALLTLCYAVVFPSHLRTEAFGIALLEGAMFGKPMISCEIGTGTTFINIDGKTGLTIAPNDANALADAMDFLWQHPEKASAMGAAASVRYEDYFTADKMVASYITLYERLCR